MRFFMAQIPRGTRDFLPDEMQKRTYLREVFEKVFCSFGYREVQTPTFEQLELFTAKSGEGIIDELYDFVDKGDRKLALRPELTAPVMRMYVDSLQMEPKPLKLFYFGNCFRYDRPQKGRYREFWQLGCELIGTESECAIAELIALAYSSLKAAGLKKIELNIGDLKIIKALFRRLGLSDEQVKYVMPLLDKECFDDVRTYLLEQDFSESEVGVVVEALQSSDMKMLKEFLIKDDEAIAELEFVESVLKILKDDFAVEEFSVRMSIVRGLDYYSGVVFEIHAPVLGAEKQICGGGMYELVSLFGGRETPTSGFAIGFDRSLLALESEGFEFPISGLDVYVIPVGAEMISPCISLVHSLRLKGLCVDFDMMNRGVGKALKYANTKNAKKVLILGPRELEEGVVTMRNMADGAQSSVPLDAVYSSLS